MHHVLSVPSDVLVEKKKKKKKKDIVFRSILNAGDGVKIIIHFSAAELEVATPVCRVRAG